MSLTLTYEPTLNRVHAAMTGLEDTAVYQLERSTDQTRWTTVRGGTAIIPALGLATVDDYEFAADVQNFYRVRGGLIDTFNRSVSNGWGSTPTGQSWTVTGTASDYSVTSSTGRHSVGSLATYRTSTIDLGSANCDYTGDVSVAVGTPTGTGGLTQWCTGRYTDANNYYAAELSILTTGVVFLDVVKRVGGTLTPLGGVQVAATHPSSTVWRIRFNVTGSTVRAKAWIPSSQTEPSSWQVSVSDTTSTPPMGTLAGLLSRAETGNTNTLPVVMVWDSFVVTDPLIVVFTGNITPPTLDAVWLKSITRPFLNQTVRPVNFPETEAQSRAGIFPVVGRSKPIGVTDLRLGLQWTQDLLVQDAAAFRKLDVLLASGDILFVQVPTSGSLSYIPSGYVVAGNTGARRPWKGDPALSVVSAPFIEVAAPGPDVVGATYTCQGVINDYATCADLLAAVATCADLLDNIGGIEDVVVP